MPGILNYQRYNELFATVKDVIEHFPSEQFTLPFDFGGQGYDGWTAEIEWQSLIIDQMSYTVNRIPVFENSTVIGCFPSTSTSQPVTGSVQLPANMYHYPMYPERLTDVPITVVGFRFTKNNQIFTRQLLLIENWEPGMEIGDPKNDPDYIPLNLTAFRIGADITLTPNPITPTDNLTISVTATNLSTATTSSVYIDNTVTVTVTAQSPNTGEVQIPVNTTTNFVDGQFTVTTTVTNAYIPTTLLGNYYNITTGTFTTSTFDFTANLQKGYTVKARWQSLRRPDGFITGGQATKTLTINTTKNYSTNLVPLTVDVLDIDTNTPTTAIYSFDTARIRARADLQSIYPEQANRVSFYADYSADYAVQRFVLPTTPTYSTQSQIATLVIPPQLATTEMLIESNPFGTQLIGQSFQFPVTNGNLNSGTFTITNVQNIIVGSNTYTKLTLNRPWTTNPYDKRFQGSATSSTSTYSVDLQFAAFTIGNATSGILFRQQQYTTGPSGLIVSQKTLASYPWSINTPNPTRTFRFYPPGTPSYPSTFSRYEFYNISQPAFTLTQAMPYFPDRNILIGRLKQTNRQTKLGQYTQWGDLQSIEFVQTAEVYAPFETTVLNFGSEYGLDSNNGQIASTWTNRIKYTSSSVLNPGASFVWNGLRYNVTSVQDNILTIDPPWYTQNPTAYGTQTNHQVAVTNVSSTSTDYLTRQITALEYTPGLGVPYYTGAYTFNRVKFNQSVPVGSTFRLAGNTQSPITTTFVVMTGTDVNGWYSIDPAYTITHPSSKPQWQLDNDTYNYFVSNEQNRELSVYYNPLVTSEGTLLAAYGETNLIFDVIPANLRIGATFSFDSTNFTVTAIDAFRNILTVSKSGVLVSSYNFVGQTTTFTNPASPATTSTFLGTASTVIQSGDNFTWYLDRTLPEGSYTIRAEVNNTVNLGTGTNYVYPKNSEVSYSLASSNGINAGLFMTLDDSNATVDRVTVTSNVNTAKDPDNFYVFQNPVTFYLNGSPYSTSTWTRQGSTFVQISTLTVAKGVLNPSFYAYWPGSLDHVRTSDDQILFVPDTLAFTPASTTTVSVSAQMIGTEIQGSGQVQIVGTPFPLQDDYIPDGTQTFKLLGYNRTWGSTTSTYTRNSETVNIGTRTMANGIATVSTQTLNLLDTAGYTKYYSLQSEYSGDTFRFASTGTSTQFKVMPNYSQFTIITPNNNFAREFDTKLRTLVPTTPRSQYQATKALYMNMVFDFWVEPSAEWPSPSTFSVNDIGYELRFQDVLSGPAYSYNPYYVSSLYPIPYPPAGTPPLPPGSYWQSETTSYTTATTWTTGIPLLKRTITFTEKWNFQSQTVINALENTSLWMRINTPVNWPNRSFNVRYNIRSISWSSTP